MKKLLLLALAVALAFTACDPQGGGKLIVPEAMIGIWKNSTANQTITATNDNIVYDTGYSGQSIDFKAMIEAAPGVYTVSHTDTSVTITASSISASYEFVVEGNTLTFTVKTGGASQPGLEFTKQ